MVRDRGQNAPAAAADGLPSISGIEARSLVPTRRAVFALLFAWLALPLLSSGADIGALPPQRIIRGIPYLSGGIGQDEQEAMKAAATRYDLLLTFVESGSGAYISDVRVAIDNRLGERVFEISTDGPLLLVKLPVGRYTVSALNGEHLLSRKVNISGKLPTRVVLQWPVESVE